LILEGRLDDPPPLLRLEDPVVGGIVVTPQTVGDVSLRKDGVYQPGLNLVVQNCNLFKFFHGKPSLWRGEATLDLNISYFYQSFLRTQGKMI
jgi:hypothetical protein